MIDPYFLNKGNCMTHIKVDGYFEKNNKDYFEKKDFPPGTVFPPLTFYHRPSDSILNGPLGSHRYRVATVEGMKYSKPVYRYLLFVPELLAALSLTILTFGTALLSPRFRNYWREIFTGRSVTQINLFLDDLPTAAQTYQASSVPLHHTPPTTGLPNMPQVNLTLPKDFPQSSLTSNPPPKNSTNTAAQPFIGFFSKKPDPSNPKIFPSLLRFSPDPHSELSKEVDFLENIDSFSRGNTIFHRYSLKLFLEGTGHAIMGATGASAKNLPTLVDRFRQRVDAYNKAIDLEERICAIKDQPYFGTIMVHDLELPWNESFLRIALLTDAEVADLTMSQIKTMNQNQLKLLGMRCQKMQPKPVGSASMTPDEFLALKLIHLQMLPQAILDQYIDDFSPPGMLRLLSSKQQDEIPLSKLSDDQFREIYSDSLRVKALAMPKLSDSIPLLERLLPQKLKELTGDQVRLLDFSNRGPITQSILTLMCGFSSSQGHLISCMNTNQVIAALNRVLFTPDTIKFVTPDQIGQIDFYQVDYRKFSGDAVMTALFSEEKNIKAIKRGLSLHRIIPFIKHKNYLRHLTLDQLQSLDFKNPAITEPDLTGIAFHPQNDLKGVQIPWLSKEQVIDALNRGLFTSDTVIYVSKQQIGMIDFRQVNCNQDKVITALFSAEEKVRAIRGKESLHCVIPHITHKYYLRHLLETQIELLDFSDQAITQADLTGMAFHPQNDLRGITICSMTKDQVSTSLNRGLFTDETVRYITPDQIKQIDFAQIDCLKAGGEKVITSLFSDGDKLKAIKGEAALHHLLPFMSHKTYLRHLTDEQVQSLNFKKSGITKADLTGMAYHHSSDSRGRLITQMTAQQLIDALNRQIFTDETAGYVTPEQISKIDFTQVDCSDEEGRKVLSALFSPASKKLPAVQGGANLHSLIPKLKKWALCYLSKEQVQCLDFSQAAITQEVLNGMVQDQNKEQPISWMKSDQVVAALNRGIFSPETAKLLLPAQLQLIDFTLVNWQNAGGDQVINALFSIGDKVKAMSVASLQHLLPFLTKKYMLCYLNEAQVRGLDFSKLTKDDLDGMTNQQFSIYKGQQITWMKEEQMIDALNHGLFTKETASCVTANQVAHVDFTKVDCAKAGGTDVFSSLLNSKKVQQIQKPASLNHLLFYLSHSILGQITDDQIKWIDFSLIKEEDTSFVKGVLQKNLYECLGRIKFFTDDQLKVCLKRKLCPEQALSNITDAQLKALSDADLQNYPKLLDRKKKL